MLSMCLAGLKGEIIMFFCTAFMGLVTYAFV